MKVWAPEARSHWRALGSSTGHLWVVLSRGEGTWSICFLVPLCPCLRLCLGLLRSDSSDLAGAMLRGGEENPHAALART